MIFRIVLFLALVFLTGFETVSALTPSAPFATEYISAYRHKMSVSGISTPVPIVTEVPIVAPLDTTKNFLVLENESQTMVPSYFKEVYSVVPTPLYAGGSQGVGDWYNLNDGLPYTGVQFELSDDRMGQIRITLTSQTQMPITSSGLTFNFERNVSLPTSIEVQAQNPGEMSRIVLAKTRMTSEYVSFIPTTGTIWTIDLTYAQPLKINELKLVEDDVERTVTRGLRFLAQPGKSYTIYQNPDRIVSLPYMESGDLVNDKGVLYAAATSPVPNERYQASDADRDGIQDSFDNCVLVSNPNQVDINQNGRGDDCDDFDRDGVSNTVDNCINLPNANQSDEDYDGIGDMCDKEESRFTERLPWVPWVGMGIAGAVLVGLFVVVGMRPAKPISSDTPDV
jgi:hypothetical protein